MQHVMLALHSRTRHETLLLAPRPPAVHTRQPQQQTLADHTDCRMLAYGRLHAPSTLAHAALITVSMHISTASLLQRACG